MLEVCSGWNFEARARPEREIKILARDKIQNFDPGSARTAEVILKPVHSVACA